MMRQPTPTRNCCKSSAFMASTRTVVRPAGVRPTIDDPQCLYWSFHRWVRGLNKATRLPVSGSMPARFGPLCRLQC